MEESYSSMRWTSLTSGEHAAHYRASSAIIEVLVNKAIIVEGECFPDMIRSLFGRGKDHQDIWTCFTEENHQILMIGN